MSDEAPAAKEVPKVPAQQDKPGDADKHCPRTAAAVLNAAM